MSLKTLQNSEDWKIFAELSQELMKKWQGNLSKFTLNSSIEDIAKDRIRWTAQIAGIESLFREMNSLIEQGEKRERSDDDE